MWRRRGTSAMCGAACCKTSPNNQPTSLAKRRLTRTWTQNYARAESVPETHRYGRNLAAAAPARFHPESARTCRRCRVAKLVAESGTCELATLPCERCLPAIRPQLRCHYRPLTVAAAAAHSYARLSLFANGMTLLTSSLSCRIITAVTNDCA